MSASGVNRGHRMRFEVSRWAHALTTLAFLALAVATASTRSVSPVVLGRYSAASFGYQLFNVATLALLVLPARCERSRRAGYILVVVSTFLAPISESVRNLPGILAALPMVRLLVAMSWIAIEFERFRRDRKSVRGFALGMGVALAALSAIDLALWGWVEATSGFDEDFEGYRDRYALETATPDDIVLVGDSFVWGHGVARSQRFGDVLERLYAGEGRRVRVFSLGVRGAGPSRYLESLARVPEGRRIGVAIFSFYPNDLAPRPRPGRPVLRLFQNVTWSLGQSSLTFRAGHDALGRLESPSVDHYHRSVIEDYRKDDPTFPGRWGELIAALDRFDRLAARRSTARPLLLLIPLMVDFRAYPLTGAHEELRAAAEGLGYDVLDLLPAFRTELGDGSRYRLNRNDNHFDAQTHQLVATLIKRHLDGRPETSGLGRSDAGSGGHARSGPRGDAFPDPGDSLPRARGGSQSSR
jgi:hypothetical protein